MGQGRTPARETGGSEQPAGAPANSRGAHRSVRPPPGNSRCNWGDIDRRREERVRSLACRTTHKPERRTSRWSFACVRRNGIRGTLPSPATDEPCSSQQRTDGALDFCEASDGRARTRDQYHIVSWCQCIEHAYRFANSPLQSIPSHCFAHTSSNGDAHPRRGPVIARVHKTRQDGLCPTSSLGAGAVEVGAPS